MRLSVYRCEPYNHLQPRVTITDDTYSVFSSDLLDQRRDNHTGHAADRVHQSVDETREVRGQVLVVGQIRYGGRPVEAQR